jgi:hypothetical protein
MMHRRQCRISASEAKDLHRLHPMTASTLQTQLLAQGVFMVDGGFTATKLGTYRFTINYAGEIERFYTLAQVKAWVKYNLD